MKMVGLGGFCLMVGCDWQSISQGLICLDTCTHCHSESEVAAAHQTRHCPVKNNKIWHNPNHHSYLLSLTTITIYDITGI